MWEVHRFGLKLYQMPTVGHTKSTMLQFIVGFTAGIYVAQTYNIPKLSVVTTYLQDKLKEIEKQQKKND